jgi:hypothetical protein
MTIPFTINGARAVIPGVYDFLRVQDNLPNPTPAGRNLFIIGEADSGVPSSYLDLQLNYFTDYNSVLSYYKAGPIVDAARQVFSNQPSVVFGGSVNRLYVYKTNNTTRAEKAISSPANYGSLVSAVWNEDGNLIREQIKTSVAEVKPTTTFAYLPLAGATRTLRAVVSGKSHTTSLLAAGAMPPAVVTALSTAIGAEGTVTGGSLRSVISADGTSGTISAVGSVATLTFTGATFSLATVVVGDILVIPQASGLKGTLNGNAGAFIIEGVTTSTITARKLWSWNATGVDGDFVTPEAATVADLLVADQGAYSSADFLVYAPITITVTETTDSGSGATLELADSTGSNLAVPAFTNYSSWLDIVSTNGTLVGDIAATVASSKLTLTLTGTIWATVPAVGSAIYIDTTSPVAGSTKQNVGWYVVNTASSTAMTLTPVGGSSIVAVAAVALGGVQPVKYQAGFVTNSISAFRITSAAENKVFIDASRSKDNAVWPTTPIGGNPVIEISYYNASVTAAKLSIDYRRKLTVTFTGGSLSPVTILTGKYRSIRELVEFINTLSGFSCRVADQKFNGYLTTILDEVTDIDILSATALPAYNARIKKDYFDWTDHFASYTTGLLAFAAGTMLLKCGLPTPEATVSYLSGATKGHTDNADVQAGLDAGMKINCSYAIPLFARDSVFDISDGLTDVLSTYDIASVNAMVKSHVATASSTLIKRERFGMQSFHGSFVDAKNAAGVSAYERCQMAFQLSRANVSTGDVAWVLPWELAVCTATGRAQSVLGTSMLRKSFNVSDVKHIGNESLYSDTLIKDFDPEDQGMLSDAIEAGLLCFKFNPGFGVQMVSPDLTTRSRQNDPQGWVWERANVLFVLDEVRQVMRSVLENYIGNRTTDVVPAVVITALQSVINTYITQGALKNGKVNFVKDLGNTYSCQVSLQPVEALEGISIDIIAERSV